MPFNTELTKKLGITSEIGLVIRLRAFTNDCLVPVVQGGMQWVGYAELVAAISNVRGIGMVGSR